MAVDVFAVPVFFVVFRESLETAIIVSVLLAFLKQTLGETSQDAIIYKKLVRQVWWGMAAGIVTCLVIGGALIGTFYSLGQNHWATTEYYWEGSFAIFASLIITLVGAALLRVSKMQDKWRAKLAVALDGKNDATVSHQGRFKRFCEKYAMFLLPFITVLREGLEAVVFVAGVSFSAPASAVPLPVFVGLIAGSIAGYAIYKSGATAKLQYFLVVSTCLLYLVAAGLLSRGVWFFEAQQWNNEVGGDAAETGSGPGSYDISKSVWHVNGANPSLGGGGGWGVFNAILGWQNSATYGTVISYNLYWVFVMAGFFLMRYKEVTGHWPLMKAKKQCKLDEQSSPSTFSSSEVSDSGVFTTKEKGVVAEKSSAVREISA